MKKSVSMLLAALMLTGALAGCGSSASGTQAEDGAGSGVNEVLMAHRKPVPVLHIGLPAAGQEGLGRIGRRLGSGRLGLGRRGGTSGLGRRGRGLGGRAGRGEGAGREPGPPEPTIARGGNQA